MLRVLPKLNGANSFLTNVLFLAGGTVIGQLLLLLVSPLLTRLFTPEDFGGMAVFMSLLGILSVVSTLRYEMAIPLNSTRRGASNVTALCLFVLFIYLLVLAVAILLSKNTLSTIFNISQDLLTLLPLGVGALSAYQIFRYFSVSQSEFKLISQSSISQSAGTAFGQVSAGVMQLGSLGLVLGIVFGRFIGLLIVARSNFSVFKYVRLSRLFTLAKRHKKFPVFTTWASLINVLGMQATPLFFSFFFNVATAGLVALTMRVLGAPSLLVGQAIGQVFYKRAANNHKQVQDNKQLVLRLVTSLFLISYPTFAFVALFGSEIFVFVFGENWRQSGEFAQYFSPWLLLSFISSPLSTIALVKGKQRTAFFITLYETILRISVLLLGATYGTARSTVILFSGVGVVISLVYIIWILKLTKSSILEWIKINQFVLLSAVILCFSLILVKQILATNYSLITAISIVGAYYIASIKPIINIFKAVG